MNSCVGNVMVFYRPGPSIRQTGKNVRAGEVGAPINGVALAGLLRPTEGKDVPAGEARRTANGTVGQCTR
jgi:hypothetical protein